MSAADLPAARPVVDVDALARSAAESIMYHPATMTIPWDERERLADAMGERIAAEAIASGVVQDAADVRRAVAEETLLATANFVEREAAAAWGGDAAWLTTGRHVAAVVAGLLRERAREVGEPR